MSEASGPNTSHLLGQGAQLFCGRARSGLPRSAGLAVGRRPGSGALGAGGGSVSVLGLPVFCAQSRTTATFVVSLRLLLLLTGIQPQSSVQKRAATGRSLSRAD